jgi:hypothetical protein
MTCGCIALLLVALLLLALLLALLPVPHRAKGGGDDMRGYDSLDTRPEDEDTERCSKARSSK